jgi:metal-responsive CopG/Arc/MetJ family transcriptional regulator
VGTINFSVPDDVKEEFNRAFKNENKSAILTRLMRQAIEEHKRQKRRAKAVQAILKLRGRQRPVTNKEIAEVRRAGRL